MMKIRRMGSFKPWGAAVSAIEMALWDIAGKAAGIPVYKLLGGKTRDKVRVYNGGVRFPMTGYNPEDYAEDMRKIMVAHGDTNKQVAVLEFGWTTDSIHPAYSWFKVDEQTQAKYIIDAYAYAKKNWSPWIGLMSLIYIANPDWTQESEEYWWSITQPNGDPRAAWVRLNMLYKQQK